MAEPTLSFAAFGDPQAPHEVLLEILDQRHLLVGGRLHPSVRIVSMGDHFDWGDPDAASRETATADGLRTLAWLASHPPEQVVLLLGNHDLSRVGELAHFDDESFAEARREADRAYRDDAPERDEASFRAAWNLPSWEVASRDLSTFSVAQRTLVRRLLEEKRFQIAFAPREDLLLSHAGVTKDELTHLGLREDTADAFEIADALAHALAEGLSQAPHANDRLVLPGLHHPGDAHAEGTGMFFHRLTRGPEMPRIPRRRFAAERLPTGFSQGIGHIRDKKTRTLLDLPPSGEKEGSLRTLTLGEGHLRYELGILPRPTDHARILYLDSGMGHTSPEAYELLDLERLAPG
jgi:3',5'-cyclic AMP phosphodiesterase CpdA